MAAGEKDKNGAMLVIEVEGLQGLVDSLRRHGYQVHGPVMRDGAITYREIRSVDELPTGWTDEQSGGKYILKKSGGQGFFDYTAGVQSWRRLLFPPERMIWSAKRDGEAFTVSGGGEPAPKPALLGVRPCELSAIAIQDRVFMWDRFSDPLYAARRRNALIVAVNCGKAGENCFCASMGSGPKAKSGFDLSMTEIDDAGRHYFVVEVGTEAGSTVMDGVTFTEAGAVEKAAVSGAVSRAGEGMRRKIDTMGIRELLYRRFESPRWERISTRCLACGNCTMACPTCFCTTVEERTSLDGRTAERRSVWDSCFTLDYSRMAGGFIMRRSIASRYRQWMMHKLAAWQEQFGTMGCVGCGRCITWCPVGIDITEEAAALRSEDEVAAGKEED